SLWPFSRICAQMVPPSLTTCLRLDHGLPPADGYHAALVSVLDGLDDGVILTDAAARPLFVNARARRIVAEADGLDIAIAPPAAAAPIATQPLREAIMCAAAGAATAPRQLRLPRSSERPPLLLTLFPIMQLDMVVPGAGVPTVAIFIRDLDAP